MMESFWNLLKRMPDWVPGDPARWALYLHIAAWFLTGGGVSALIGSFLCISGEVLGLLALNAGGLAALGPGFLGGLYWWLNHDE
ncbi:MAG: hypothetical protein Q4F29_11595 [Lachnospiraceae bacterium]|nr:hypothetical protein [Lachnospiraceae bacterium]